MVETITEMLRMFDIEKDESSYICDGCDYDELGDAMLVGSFGFCGCGCPDLTAGHIVAGLEHIDRLTNLDRGNWDAEYAIWHNEKSAIFGSEGGAYFFYYWADKEGLTEHGGSVPGWLTNKGKAAIALLTEELKPAAGAQEKEKI